MSNKNKMPIKMTRNCMKIPEKDVPEAFATHFEDKVSTMTANIVINDSVYNGVI